MRNLQTSDKIHILKKYEVECYRIAFYLLQDLEKAWSSTEQSLIELFRMDSFFHDSEQNQKNILKKISTKNSLAVYRNHLLGD